MLQLEYIAGNRWNNEYNTWLVTFCRYPGEYKYHSLAKINRDRDINKVHEMDNAVAKCYYAMIRNVDIVLDRSEPIDMISIRIPPPYIDPGIPWKQILEDTAVRQHTYPIKKGILRPNILFPDLKLISQSREITWEIIRDNPGYPWNWDGVSSNLNITWDIIRDNPGYPWNWDSISLNLNITWKIIQLNTILPWDKFNILRRRCKPYKWNWSCISCRPDITWKIIQANPGYPWNWDYVMINPNITLDIIKANPGYPWDWEHLSTWKNITFDFIIINRDKSWNKTYLCDNEYPEQAKQSIAKYKLKATYQANYLARYVHHSLMIITLDHGC